MGSKDQQHEGYERRVGRWSRIACRMFLDWLALERGLRWLDVGSGPGATTLEILERSSPSSVVALEPTDALDVARVRIADPRITFLLGSAEAIELPNASFDVVVSGLVLNHLKDKTKAMQEMVRVTHPGGTIAGYVWDYGGEMQMMRLLWEAAIALDPAALEKSQGKKFSMCKPGPLTELFQSAGLADVTVHAVDAPTVFRDFDDFWVPMTTGDGSIVDYVNALPEDRRTALRERLRATLPKSPDGTIPLIARAFCVRGRV